MHITKKAKALHRGLKTDQVSSKEGPERPHSQRISLLARVYKAEEFKQPKPLPAR
jgi:hypothetical protein